MKNNFLINFKRFKKQYQLQLMVIPFVLYALVFMYGPMLGLVQAFQDYRIGIDDFGRGQWVGFKHFIEFMSRDEFWLIMRNTLGLNLTRLIVGFPFPIIFALLLNEVKFKTFKRGIQTISYLPHFISWVVAAGVVLEFLSSDGGLLNEILLKIGIIDQPIMFMGEKNLFWIIVVFSNIWKEMGWGAIIYLAAIAGIDKAIYEAAEIDGASRWKQIFHVTLSGIKPTIVVLLILQMGMLLNHGYEDVMLLTNNLRNTMLSEVSEIIDTYVLRTGINQLKFSYATAVTLFRAILSLMFVYIGNAIARRIGDGENSLW